MLKYVVASPGQEFMVGKKLAFGTGACWGAVSDAATAAAKLAASGKPGGAAPSLYVPDVSENDSIHYFKGAAAAAASVSHGSYAAVPIVGADGSVVGLLGVDTVTQV